MQEDIDKVKNKQIKQESENSRFVAFDSAEEAWFWFIQAQQASLDGARFVAGASLTPRPCEPSDILNILNRLYRNRLLLWDHMLVLRYYGRRQMAPDFNRVKEMRAHKLWGEAMKRLEPIFIRRGIMNEKKSFKSSIESWAEEAQVYCND